jgi:hypothetical protein
MSTESLTPDQVKVILDAVQAIGGNIVNIKRYPPGSSIIKMALERAMSHFDAIFESIESFTVSESEKQLLVNNERLLEKYAQLAFVVKFLVTIMERNVRSLTFSRGLTFAEIESFIDLLGHSPEQLKHMGVLADLLEERNVQHIHVDAKVFVAITKNQAIAEISDLERLGEDTGLAPEQMQDSTLFKYVMSKLQHAETELPPEKLKELKQQIDYEKLSHAKTIDFERIGPMIVASLEKWQEDVHAVEAGGGVTGGGGGAGGGGGGSGFGGYGAYGADTSGVADAVAADIGPSISPELAKAIQAHNVTIREDAAEAEREERVDKLTQTFQGISQALFSFKQANVRTKLLNDFLKIVTNFKTQTLSRLLSSQMATDRKQDEDIKAHILTTLSLKKKSALIDLFLQKYQRWIEGLSPADFEMNSEQVENAEDVLRKLAEVMKNQQHPPELAEKAQRALTMISTLRQEAPSPEKLLILKVRRLLNRDPSYYVEEKVQAYIPDLILRLVDVKRPDVAKKILERLFQNTLSENPDDRLRVAGVLVRVSQSLLDAKVFVLHGAIFGLLLRAFRREPEQHVYPAFLAALVADLGRLIDEGNFNLAIQVFKGLNTLREHEDNDVKTRFLAMAEQKIASHDELIIHLLDKFTDADEKQSELALQVLTKIDQNSAATMMFNLLLESEEMRVRKKALSVLTRMPEAAVPMLLKKLGESGHPWYFVRNLVHLAADLKAPGVEAGLTARLRDENEQVRKATLATLIRLGTPAADEILAAQLSELDAAGQRMIVNHLAHSRSAAAVDFMIDTLDLALIDRDEPFAIDLINALGRVSDQRALPLLKKILQPGGFSGLFKSKPNDKIVTAILRALGNLGGDEAKVMVGKYVRNANPEVARAAQSAMKILSPGA